MVSFEKRKKNPPKRRSLTSPIFERGWTLTAWLILGLLGMGDIETPLLMYTPCNNGSASRSDNVRGMAGILLLIQL